MALGDLLLGGGSRRKEGMDERSRYGLLIAGRADGEARLRLAGRENFLRYLTT